MTWSKLEHLAIFLRNDNGVKAATDTIRTTTTPTHYLGKCLTCRCMGQLHDDYC